MPLLELEILLHVITDTFDFAVTSLSKLVDNQVRIVATKVVEDHWNFNTDQALQVTSVVGGADKPACNVVMVTEFGATSITFFKLVSADVSPRGIIIFLLLASTKAIHRTICSKFLNYLRFPNNKGV